VGDERGLKWKDIDWTRNTIRLYAKKKERLVPMHPTLREMLVERKNALGLSAHAEAHIISLVRDTLSDYFSKARLKAGINKPGAVHILRHSAATAMLESGANIREIQTLLGHSTIAVTEIYTHVVQEKLESAVARARLNEHIKQRSNVMAKRFNPPDERTIYLAELEQLEQNVRALRQRVTKARRAVQADKWIHWAHVGDVKHVNSKLAELVEFWQPKYDNKPTLHQTL
jgi:DNA-binding FrmR family transcriptional regulator